MSVVVPVVNEERHLEASVGAILRQDWGGPLQVVLALGPSTDATDAIARRLAEQDQRVTLVANPTGRTPSGLNAAIAAAAYDVIVRVDGHAVIPADYVRTGVETLERTGADNVGGVMAAEGTTPMERAVACAMTSWFGVGGASFHIGGAEGPAPTVYLGCFRRSALERVGGYDESMLRAQDWEMNHRIIETGGEVWFTPAMRVSYRPRASLRALAVQYLNYGRWRREVARRHQGTMSLRYLAAPLAVAAIAGGLVLAVVGGVLGVSWLAGLGLVPIGGYAAAVGLASVLTGRGLPASAWLRLPAAYATMHMSWGAGFIVGVPKRLQPG